MKHYAVFCGLKIKKGKGFVWKIVENKNRENDKTLIKDDKNFKMAYVPIKFKLICFQNIIKDIFYYNLLSSISVFHQTFTYF